MSWIKTADEAETEGWLRRPTGGSDGVSRIDVDALPPASLRDEDILDVNLMVSSVHFVSRIPLGLGVEFTPEEVRGYKA